MPVNEQDNGSIVEITRLLLADAQFRADFTSRLEARTVNPATLQRLIAYARERHVTSGHAIARRVLTEAGISWEAL